MYGNVQLSVHPHENDASQRSKCLLVRRGETTTRRRAITKMAKMTKIIIKTFLAFTPYPFAMLDEYRTHFRLLFSLTAVVAYKTNTLKGIFRSDYYFSTLKQGKARE
jgi:hypothetical protein